MRYVLAIILAFSLAETSNANLYRIGPFIGSTQNNIEYVVEQWQRFDPVSETLHMGMTQVVVENGVIQIIQSNPFRGQVVIRQEKNGRMSVICPHPTEGYGGEEKYEDFSSAIGDNLSPEQRARVQAIYLPYFGE